MPTGHESDGTPVPAHVYPAKAAGGLFADASDVARFVAREMVGPYHSAGGILSDESTSRAR